MAQWSWVCPSVTVIGRQGVGRCVDHTKRVFVLACGADPAIADAISAHLVEEVSKFPVRWAAGSGHCLVGLTCGSAWRGVVLGHAG